jgi:hypothetical protein
VIDCKSEKEVWCEAFAVETKSNVKWPFTRLCDENFNHFEASVTTHEDGRPSWMNRTAKNNAFDN